MASTINILNTENPLELLKLPQYRVYKDYLILRCATEGINVSEIFNMGDIFNLPYNYYVDIGLKLPTLDQLDRYIDYENDIDALEKMCIPKNTIWGRLYSYSDEGYISLMRKYHIPIKCRGHTSYERFAQTYNSHHDSIFRQCSARDLILNLENANVKILIDYLCVYTVTCNDIMARYMHDFEYSHSIIYKFILDTLNLYSMKIDMYGRHGITCRDIKILFSTKRYHTNLKYDMRKKLNSNQNILVYSEEDSGFYYKYLYLVKNISMVKSLVYKYRPMFNIGNKYGKCSIYPSDCVIIV